METQFITDKKGKKIAVVISIEEYNNMLEKIEAIEDVKLYDKAKENPEESIAAEKAFDQIENER